MFFTPLSVEAIDAVIAFTSHARVRVIYRDEREEARVPSVIESAAAMSLSVRVFRRLQSATHGCLSRKVDAMIERLFLEPKAFRRMGPMLAEHGIARAELASELHRAGVQTLHVLRRIARVSQAYQLVAEFDARLEDVAMRVGAGTVASLTRDIRLLTKLNARHLCSSISADELTVLAVRAGMKRAHAMNGLD